MLEEIHKSVQNIILEQWGKNIHLKYLHNKMKNKFLKCVSDKAAKITLVEMKAQNHYICIFHSLFQIPYILSQFK